MKLSSKQSDDFTGPFPSKPFNTFAKYEEILEALFPHVNLGTYFPIH